MFSEMIGAEFARHRGDHGTRSGQGSMRPPQAARASVARVLDGEHGRDNFEDEEKSRLSTLAQANGL
jgi:hypothetical protein